MNRKRSPYATLAVVQERGVYRFLFAGYSATNVRTMPTVRMMRALFPDRQDTGSAVPSTCFVQYDDYAHHDIPSVAFGRRVNEGTSVGLIPDTYFFQSQGYDRTRKLALEGALPKWDDRRPIAFWRGSPTTNYELDGGEKIVSIEQIPRVAMCQLLKNDSRCDAGISNHWGFRFSKEAMIAHFQDNGFHRPGIPMQEHAQFRFLIDIDGVANAWSLFDKLLMGSCIIKVRSQFEQWYYHHLQEWVHYVPVASDLSDFADVLDWCLSHQSDAEQIAMKGQSFALRYTFELACRDARSAISSCSLDI